MGRSSPRSILFHQGEAAASRAILASGIILAGGRSSRMGRDKALLQTGDETLLGRTTRILSAVVDEVLVVGRSELPSECLHAIAMPDDEPDTGPMGGIATGLQHMRSERAAVVACDLPFLSPAVPRFLLESLDGFDAVVPRVYGRIQPTCAVYARGCLQTFRQHIARGEYRLGHALSTLQVRWIEEELSAVDHGHRSFLNPNTIEEWQELRRQM
ncbi:MAG TPA: molybdenum cofactor guanylyltransferase [Chloroflexota bacterium]